jgi:hypothetical protein
MEYSAEVLAQELRHLLQPDGKLLFAQLPVLYGREYSRPISLKKSALRRFIETNLSDYSVQSIDGNPGRVWVIDRNLLAEISARLDPVPVPCLPQRCAPLAQSEPKTPQQVTLSEDDVFKAELLQLFQTGDKQYYCTLPSRYISVFPDKSMRYQNKKLRAFIEEHTTYTVKSSDGTPGRLIVVKKEPSGALVATPVFRQSAIPEATTAATITRSSASSDSVTAVTEDGPPQPLLMTRKPIACPVQMADSTVRKQLLHTAEVVSVPKQSLRMFSEEKVDTPAATSLLSYILAPPAKQSPGARAQDLLVDGERLTSNCGILGVRSTIGSTKHSDGSDKEEKASSVPSIASVSDTVYLNTEAPFCAICIGVQGAGKSHTMNVVLENCLLSTVEDYTYPARPVIRTHQSMAGLVLHFDQSQANMCETVGLVEPTPKLRNIDNTQVSNMVILVSPTFYKQRKAFYEPLNVEVHPLLFDWTTMTAQQLRKLMRLCDTDAQLYVSTMLSTLRDYQRDGHVPEFSSFLKEIEGMCDVASQAAPLRQV